MDIGENLKASFQLLKTHPSLVAPLVLSSVFSLVLLLVLLTSQLVTVLLPEYEQHKLDYYAMLAEREGADTSKPSAPAFSDYLDETGWTQKAVPYGKPVLVWGIILFLVQLFALSTTFVSVKDVLAGELLHWPGVLGETTRRFLPSVFGLFIIPSLIILVPVAAIVSLIITSVKLQPVLGFMVLTLGIIGIVAWILYALVKLTLVGGAYFVDERGVLEATAHSWKHARGHFWHVALLLLVYTGVTTIGSSALSVPLSQASAYYVTSMSLSTLVLVSVIGMLQAVVSAAFLAFGIVLICLVYRVLVAQNVQNIGLKQP